MTRVGIVGAGMTKFGTHADVTIAELFAEAALPAFDDMGVGPGEVDALCFGGTKNGAPVGDVVVFFDTELAEEFGYRCKQAGQLASKMRFLAAPWVGMLETGAWLENARHANRCAGLMAEQLRTIPGVEVMMPVEANAVFAHLPPEIEPALLERGWRFYNFIGHGGARLMCAWDTTEDDVAAFVHDVRQLREAAEPSA
jgi:threonine aldolase